MRKEGIHDLTIQSSVLQAFEKKRLWKERKREKYESKIEHPKFIFASAVPGQLRKTIDRISTRTTYEKTDFFEGCLELSVNLSCTLPLPPHLPTQSSFLELFERKR